MTRWRLVPDGVYLHEQSLLSERQVIRDTDTHPFFRDGAPDHMSMGIPLSWRSDPPKDGWLKLKVQGVYQQLDFPFRLANAGFHGLWNVGDVGAEEPRTSWWMSLEEAPQNIMELGLMPVGIKM